MRLTLTYRLWTLLFIPILLLGCQKENMGDCFKSTGKVTRETRFFEHFTSLEVEDNVNVFITFGDYNEAIVEAGSNLMPLIRTEVNLGKLIIRNDNKCNWVRSLDVPINVYLQCVDIESITSRGFGLVETIDLINRDVFTAEHWLASGKIKLRLNTQETYLKSHTGVGDFECSGNTDYLYLYSSSHGVFRTENLLAASCYAWNLGSGDFHVNVSDSLHARIENLGDVYYNQNVQSVTSFITGSGQLIQY